MSEYVAFLRLLYDAVVADDGVLKPLEAVAFTDIAVEAGLIHLGLPTASLEDLDANAADSARAEVAATVAANRAAAKASAASIAEEPARKAMEAAHDTAEGAARKADEELEERRAWQEARWKARLQAYGDGAYGKDVFGRLYSAPRATSGYVQPMWCKPLKGHVKGTPRRFHVNIALNDRPHVAGAAWCRDAAIPSAIPCLPAAPKAASTAQSTWAHARPLSARSAVMCALEAGCDNSRAPRSFRPNSAREKSPRKVPPGAVAMQVALLRRSPAAMQNFYMRFSPCS